MLTQDGRLIRITTPLSSTVVVTGFRGEERVSGLYRFEVDLASESLSIAAADIVLQAVCVTIDLAGGTQRCIHGIVSRFTQLPSQNRLGRYRAVIVPKLWLLTRSQNCRIFQQKTLQQILEDVLTARGITDREVSLTGLTTAREYCVQYRESDFHFLSRLMEEEGVFYFFRHSTSAHTLVLSNQKTVYQDCPDFATVNYEPTEGSLTAAEDYVRTWERSYEVFPGKWSLQDYNFKTPTASLSSSVDTVVTLSGLTGIEVYDYPGEYDVRAEGDRYSGVRMEQEEVTYDNVTGEGNVRSFVPGYTFTLQRFERRDQNAGYLLTSVSHEATQGGLFGEGGEAARYSNRFTCIPKATLYRPPRVTPRPMVKGSQTAKVVGPSGQEIYTDDDGYGQVKVQFHWDRDGQSNESSSCWIRVAQTWAGSQFGSWWIPRMGTEVLVDFLEGDPDRPIIIGQLYNASTMPPFALPTNKTQSGFQSRSSLQGAVANANIIRFEDKKDNEVFFVQAEKDRTAIVKNHDTLTVNNGNRTITVETGTDTHTIKSHREATIQEGNDTLTVSQGNRSATISQGNDTLTVSQGNMEVTVSQGNVTEKSPSGTFTIEAMNIEEKGSSGIKLTCGASSIELTPSSIKIASGGSSIELQAAMMTLRSGMININ